MKYYKIYVERTKSNQFYMYATRSDGREYEEGSDARTGGTGLGGGLGWRFVEARLPVIPEFVLMAQAIKDAADERIAELESDKLAIDVALAAAIADYEEYERMVANGQTIPANELIKPAMVEVTL